MDARQMSTFLAIFDHGSVTRAAQSLYTAQPALSQTLLALESELGVDLFERTPKGMTPTAAGYALVAPARQVLTATSDIDRTVEHLRTLRTGRLKIACPTSLVVDPVAPVIARFRRGHPGVVVEVTEPAPGESVASTVLLGQSDLGVDLLPCTDNRLELHPMGQRSAHLALAPNCRLKEAYATPPELADLPLVCGPPSASLRSDVDGWFAGHGVTPRVVVETDFEEHLWRLVEAGAGSAFIPEHSVETARERGLTVVQPRPAILRGFGLVWPRTEISSAASALIQQVRTR